MIFSFRKYSLCLVFLTLFLSLNLHAQVAKDLSESVPLWLDFEEDSDTAELKWIPDGNATQYAVSKIKFEPFTLTTPLGNVDGTTNNFALGVLTPGTEYFYHVQKSSSTTTAPGIGIIRAGLKLPAVHARGKCLIAIDDTLSEALEIEIDQLILDLAMDGWQPDTLHITREMGVKTVKEKIKNWHDPSYELSQSLLLLGHIAVPYAGNTAYDGHSNHFGAWAADSYYAEMNGNWTDNSVNNVTPSRPENDNVPGDGKFDQSLIPGDVELEVGRIDMYDLPAFTEGEIELTRLYLEKNHAFRSGMLEYPRRAIVENNFASFDEGFGQSAWRNYVPMLGEDAVKDGDYETQLDTSRYLCSYACGGGSYTSCSGVGNTTNLWVERDIKTIFTMLFGSYFGDWDIKNSFLRAALASGDVLTNAWSGRPIWQLFDMALGKHIGYSAKFTQNTSGNLFSQGYGAHSTHIALMGDPTLRLHPVKPISNLSSVFEEGDITITWDESPEADNGYFIYRRIDQGNWELQREYSLTNTFTDTCVLSNTTYDYMVKAIRLERTGSGSYYNTSLGVATEILSGENPYLQITYLDADGDGFGTMDVDTLACGIPAGYVDNLLDCDDFNPNINPDADEIADNGIDEDCDGNDLSTDILNADITYPKVFPNPLNDQLFFRMPYVGKWSYHLSNSNGIIVQSGPVLNSISLKHLPNGFYWISISNEFDKVSQKIQLTIIH